MTKSYEWIFSLQKNSYNAWEESIIAPKLTLKSFVDELHYFLRLYLIKNKNIWKILLFLMLNGAQRIFYTLGTFLIKIKKKNISSYNLLKS